MQMRYAASELIAFAQGLFGKIGLTKNESKVTAEILLAGDLMGHTTHGLQLLAPYLQAIEKGAIASTGAIEVIADRGAAALWDGNWLIGPPVVRAAMDHAFQRAAQYGVATVAIRRCGHIGCLAAYPVLAAERGLVMLLTCSDPSVASVAPHGAVEGRYTPNPIAAGWPAGDGTVVLDISASTTTNGMVHRLRDEPGARLPGSWLIGRDGQATDDPGALGADPPGAILPLGGIDLGHKGYALGLLVEALTAALGGHGRADRETRWGASVFLQVIDPAAFAGPDAFRREAGFMAEACRAAAPRPGGAPVRTPGERALALRARQLRDGVALHAAIMPALAPWAAKLGVPPPRPLSD